MNIVYNHSMYNAHGSKSSLVTFQLQFQNFGVMQRTAWRHYSIDVLRDAINPKDSEAA